jgi:hypothetical protein
MGKWEAGHGDETENPETVRPTLISPDICALLYADRSMKSEYRVLMYNCDLGRAGLICLNWSIKFDDKCVVWIR